jgi:NAD(P)-dependent dehydrogenase (short-subunit alcohol dehydrogenase family)
MNLQFENKVTLVTGATSGIGRATAMAFGREGAKVVLAGRREREGLDVAALINKAGGEAMFVRTDVASETEVAALVAESMSTYGGLDVAFNNAGVEDQRRGRRLDGEMSAPPIPLSTSNSKTHSTVKQKRRHFI